MSRWLKVISGTQMETVLIKGVFVCIASDEV